MVEYSNIKIEINIYYLNQTIIVHISIKSECLPGHRIWSMTDFT